MTEEKFSELKDISIENSKTEKQNKTEKTHMNKENVVRTHNGVSCSL